MTGVQTCALPISKRLLKGLETQIPDLQKRIDHIYKNQIFGIAITELTSLLSKRTLYCSKYPNSKYSVTKFDSVEGNIRFRETKHEWKNNNCVFCGANKANYDRDEALESHAYEFIHTTNPEELWNMKFDVIIGNPPYQMSDGGDSDKENRKRGGAIPLYHKFVQQAKKLEPHFLTMIIPSRWFAGGRGLDEFREQMLNDNRISKIIDYPISSECFQGVEIKGGICYFLWDKNYRGECEIKTIRNGKSSTLRRPLLENKSSVFIRYNESISILRKIVAFNEKSFELLVSTQKPFGFRTFYKGKTNAFKNSIKLYGNKNISYVALDDVSLNQGWISKHKVYISMAYGAGEDFPHQIINKPFYGQPNSCCTETYLVIGPFQTKEAADNVISYIKTRFFRFLILLKKNTQHASKTVYQFVPMQDFSESWTDEKLYKKYGLNEEEIAFIESMIRPMDSSEEK